MIFEKLQRLDRGNMSVQEYYQELQKGMLRCEGIIDYKEYHSIQRLFHFICWQKKTSRVANSEGEGPSCHERHRH
jgi:hypothetical protein